MTALFVVVMDSAVAVVESLVTEDGSTESTVCFVVVVTGVASVEPPPPVESEINVNGIVVVVVDDAGLGPGDTVVSDGIVCIVV
jgi:hypothetical protein